VPFAYVAVSGSWKCTVSQQRLLTFLKVKTTLPALVPQLMSSLKERIIPDMVTTGIAFGDKKDNKAPEENVLI